MQAERSRSWRSVSGDTYCVYKGVVEVVRSRYRLLIFDGSKISEKLLHSTG